MKITAQLLSVVAAATFATTALAAERASDATYIAAARCQGMARAASADTARVDTFLNQQRGGRDSFVLDRANEARRAGERTYRRAGAEGQRLLQSGVCASFSTRLAAGGTSTNR